MGVDDVARMARQTSTPLSPGIIRSVITRSGGHSAKRRRPSSGSLAVRTSKACADKEARNTRVICGSSSMTRTRPGIFVVLPSEAYIIRAGGYHSDRDQMNLKSKVHHYMQWLGATLAAVLTTVGLAIAGVRATTAGMVFLMVVVVTASQADILISLYGALLCAMSFDYFFLPPI